MKTFIDFIIKILIFLVAFLAILFFSSILYAYLFANKNNSSFKSAVSYVQSIGNEIIDYAFSNKNNDIISLNPNTNNENILLESSNTKFKYYYNQLDDNAKIIYAALENNIDNLKKENYVIDFSTKFNDYLHTSNAQRKLNKSFQSALDAFFYDYPELFFIDINKISLIIKYSSLGPITTYTVNISPKNNNYLHDSFSSESEVNIAISKVENIKNNLINTLSSDNDYIQILKLHDTLINSLEYSSNTTETNTHNIYGALVKKRVVCEGYAKAFKYILDSLEIENILVSGNATNTSGETEAHMWNYVKLNKNWYGIDVTWDDPIIIGASYKDNIRHTYFLKGNRTFIESHVPSGKISNTGMLFSIPTLNKSNYKQ